MVHDVLMTTGICSIAVCPHARRETHNVVGSSSKTNVSRRVAVVQSMDPISLRLLEQRRRFFDDFYVKLMRLPSSARDSQFTCESPGERLSMRLLGDLSSCIRIALGRISLGHSRLPQPYCKLIQSHEWPLHLGFRAFRALPFGVRVVRLSHNLFRQKEYCLSWRVLTSCVRQPRLPSFCGEPSSLPLSWSTRR